MSKITIIALLFSTLLSAKEINTFKEAKEALVEFYAKNKEYQTDFYCNAPFQWVKNRFEVVPSEAYTPRNVKTKKGKINARAQVIEWEHIMPAHNFGKHLPCWRQGGRKECQKDKTFKKMEADLQNLAPSIGEINDDRSNYRFVESPKRLRFTQYGNCKVYTNFKAKRFYPANYSKGWIARSYLYMSKTYNIKLSNQERKLMESWDRQYPMSEREKVFREFATRK
ncbi:endonuclease [Helicobacter sp.]|uniref:endonuclease n=1 Tax=Helicobacter sp. TaxID=218 RepID=UPI0019C55FC3|nr:endonuclease [Helicobacter sp.]MBD5164591.1 deoxyribonuclease [Helicobacter sp.]